MRKKERKDDFNHPLSFAIFMGVCCSETNEQHFSVEFPLQTWMTVTDTQQPASIINNFWIFNILPGKGKGRGAESPDALHGDLLPCIRDRAMS